MPNTNPESGLMAKGLKKPEDLSYGPGLAYSRKRWGLSQKELGTALSYADGDTVSRMESESRPPAKPFVKALVHFCKTRGHDLPPGWKEHLPILKETGKPKATFVIDDEHGGNYVVHDKAQAATIARETHAKYTVYPQVALDGVLMPESHVRESHT